MTKKFTVFFVENIIHPIVSRREEWFPFLMPQSKF
jgi:hypothetical protein